MAAGAHGAFPSSLAAPVADLPLIARQRASHTVSGALCPEPGANGRSARVTSGWPGRTRASIGVRSAPRACHPPELRERGEAAFERFELARAARHLIALAHAAHHPFSQHAGRAEARVSRAPRLDGRP